MDVSVLHLERSSAINIYPESQIYPNSSMKRSTWLKIPLLQAVLFVGCVIWYAM